MRFAALIGFSLLAASPAIATNYPSPTFNEVYGDGGQLTYTPPDANAQGRLFQAKLQETVSVTDWIPIGTNLATTDVSVYFQNAATNACARSPNGLHILIPAGTFIAHDILNTCPNFWEGAGPGGFGNANWAAVSALTPGVTTIKYSAATSYLFAWIVPGFPAFRSSNHMQGGGISNMTLNDGASSAWALMSEGTQDWRATYLVINGAYNGTFMKGVEFPVTSHISMYTTRNRNYQIVGDLTGETSAGAACTTSNGDCSTRNDAWFGDYLTNIDNTNTNTVFDISGFVATTTLTHTSGEGPYNGMTVECPAGMNANLGNCPQFGRFEDIQFENYGNKGVSLTDSLNTYFDHLYSVGNGTTGGVAFEVKSANYTGTAVPNGRVQLLNSELFATTGDCAFVGGVVWDVKFIADEINGCNISNGGGNGINMNSAVGSHFLISDSQIGNVDNYSGSNQLGRAIYMGVGVVWADIHDNNFDGNRTGQSPVYSAATSGGTIHVHDNQGPGSTGPSLGACGTSPTFSGYAKNEALTVVVGSGSPTSCTINFSEPMYQTPVCVLTPSSGASAAALSLSSSTSTVVLNGTALSGSYQIMCRVP